MFLMVGQVVDIVALFSQRKKSQQYHPSFVVGSSVVGSSTTLPC